MEYNNIYNNNDDVNNKCSKFYNVNDNNSPTTTKLTTTTKYSPTTTIKKNIENNYENTKEKYENLKEPEYDISFKFNAKAKSSSPNSNNNSNNNNKNSKQFYYTGNSNYNCRNTIRNDSPPSRGSLKSYDSCGGTSGSYESFHSSIYINCSICSSNRLCKLMKHNDNNGGDLSSVHQYYYKTGHRTAIAATSGNANVIANSNAEDNNRKYTMILSRSCKPLKFSFASEWLV